MAQTLTIRTSKQIARLLSGAYCSVFHGSGVEFREFREYLPGDDARQIDWRASSKSDKVFVRRYEEERSIEVLFVIDVGVHMQFGSEVRSKADFTADLLRLLLDAITEGGDRFGAYFFTDRLIEHIPVSKWDRASQILIDRYQSVGAENKVFSNMTRVIDALASSQIRRRLIFVISDDYERFSSSVPESLKTLAMSNDVICFFPYDPLERTLASSLFLRVANNPSGSMMLGGQYSTQSSRFDAETGRIWQTFRDAHIDSLFLDTSSDLFPALMGFFEQHTSRISRS